MNNAIKSATQAVAANLTLAALSRIGVPILLAIAAYAATQLIDFGQRLKVLEQSRIQGRAEIIGRIESLEIHDRSDAVANAEIIKKIAGIEANQTWQLRALDRIESLLNGNGRQHQ